MENRKRYCTSLSSKKYHLSENNQVCFLFNISSRNYTAMGHATIFLCLYSAILYYKKTVYSVVILYLLI